MMFVNANSSGKIDIKCNYYEAEANVLSSNTLKGVKLHLFHKSKTTRVPKVYFLTPFPTVDCNNSRFHWSHYFFRLLRSRTFVSLPLLFLRTLLWAIQLLQCMSSYAYNGAITQALKVQRLNRINLTRRPKYDSGQINNTTLTQSCECIVNANEFIQYILSRARHYISII